MHSLSLGGGCGWRGADKQTSSITTLQSGVGNMIFTLSVNSKLLLQTYTNGSVLLCELIEDGRIPRALTAVCVCVLLY